MDMGVAIGHAEETSDAFGTRTRHVARNIHRRSQIQVQGMGETDCTQHRADGAASALWRRIQAVYERAQRDSSAVQTDTNTRTLTDSQHSIDFTVRVAAQLRDKPKPAVDGGIKRAWKNPFLPYEEGLFVQDLSATHVLLLNKYNVVAHHCLVVTRVFEHQTDPLNAADLAATWQVLQAMPDGGVAYFNCGEQSGASQPHKHVQVVPLPLAQGQPPTPPFWPLMQWSCDSGDSPAAGRDTPVALRSLPFQSYFYPLHDGIVPQQLAMFMDAMLATITSETAAAKLSYNVLLTRQFIQVIPRCKECSGPAAVNSLGFAGTLFVRSQQELDYILMRGPMSILQDVGLPWRD